MSKKAKKIEFETGSGSVYSDLGLDDAEELQARAMIGYHVITLLKEKKLKQREISELLNIKQPEASHLVNGHFSRFTIDKLLEFLKRMDQKVSISISPHKQGEPYQDVAFVQ